MKKGKDLNNKLEEKEILEDLKKTLDSDVRTVSDKVSSLFDDISQGESLVEDENVSQEIMEILEEYADEDGITRDSLEELCESLKNLYNRIK